MLNSTDSKPVRTGPTSRDSRGRGPNPAPIDNRTPFERFLDALRAAGCDPQPEGDHYTAFCPGHRGERRNLVVSVGRDGRVLLHCHAHGCSVEGIVAALGLTMADLFPVPPERRGRGNRAETRSSAASSLPAVSAVGPDPAATPTLTVVSPPTSAAKTKPGRRKPGVYSSPYVAAEIVVKALRRDTCDPTWERGDGHMYRAADNSPVFAVFRIENGAGEKTYRPIRRIPSGWQIGDPRPPFPLYRLSQVIASSRVYVVEGEKVADRLRLILGLTATTSAHGAKSPRKTDWTPLSGKDIVICPDHDESGQAYCAQLLQILSALNPRPRVQILPLSVVWRDRFSPEIGINQ